MDKKTQKIPIEYLMSLRYSSFIWLPAKTASTTLSWIFRYFDFQKYTFDNNQFQLVNNQPVHLGHLMYFPPNHLSQTFICSIRNPYDAIFSYYRMSQSYKNNSENKDSLETFLNHILKDYNSPITSHLLLFENRIPDFVIRTENIFDDIVKIPFVRDSNIYKCGVIEEMCEKKFNISPKFSHEKIFNNEQIQKINSMFYKIFELGNYEKL